MITETTITRMTEQTAMEFHIPLSEAHNYDLISVTSSDYDEGGDNKVTMCFPCSSSTPLWAAEVQRALSTCKKNTMETLSLQLERTRKREKFFVKLFRLARREFRYFLSITKMGKEIGA